MTAFDVSERRIWDGRAESYARTFARLRARTVPALLDAAAAGRGTRLLDVGCGSGSVAVAAVGRGAVVRAVDAEPGMVAATRRAAPGVEVRTGSREAGVRRAVQGIRVAGRAVGAAAPCPAGHGRA